MLDIKTFQAIVAIERKLERGETLSAEDEVLVKKHGIVGPKTCGHKGCTNKLGSRVDGEHHKVGGQEVCEDCYFETFGEEIEKYPIGRGQVRGIMPPDIDQL